MWEIYAEDLNIPPASMHERKNKMPDAWVRGAPKRAGRIILTHILQGGKMMSV
jgi:hypothetical protein